MTQQDIDEGQVVCLIGVAPVQPAEFVIFRIGQWTTGRCPLTGVLSAEEDPAEERLPVRVALALEGHAHVPILPR